MQEAFLCAQPDFDAFADGKAQVVARLLVKGGQQLVLGLVFDIEAEHIIGLYAVKVFAAGVVGVPQLFHDLDKAGIVAFDVRVELERVCVMLFGQRRSTAGQLAQRVFVMDVAHRAAGGIH